MTALPVTNPARPDDRRQLFALNVVRGLACVLVLWRHMPSKPQVALHFTERWVAAIHEIGWCGVDLFFVLSGALISQLLFREIQSAGRLKVVRFWIRREFKIWPAYFVAYGSMVIACLIAAGWYGDAESFRHHMRTIVPNSLFYQNYLPVPMRWDNSWSIAVEEHFYFLLPLVFAALAAWRRGVHAIPILVLGAVVGCLLMRLKCAASGGPWRSTYYPTHMRFDSLMWGVFIGYLWTIRPTVLTWLAKLWPVWIAGALGALTTVGWLGIEANRFTYTWGFTLLFLAFGGVVATAIARPDFGRNGALAFAGRPLAWVGVYSYTIYLAHSVVPHYPGMNAFRMACMKTYGGPDALGGLWIDRVLFWTLSVLGGVLLSHLIERPALRLRQRWFPSRQTEVARPQIENKRAA